MAFKNMNKPLSPKPPLLMLIDPAKLETFLEKVGWMNKKWLCHGLNDTLDAADDVDGR